MNITKPLRLCTLLACAWLTVGAANASASDCLCRMVNHRLFPLPDCSPPLVHHVVECLNGIASWCLGCGCGDCCDRAECCVPAESLEMPPTGPPPVATPSAQRGATVSTASLRQPTEAGEPAQVVVYLPADAKLTVDGNLTNGISYRRTFLTPNLEAGVRYTYTLQVEISRGGKRVVETRDVVVTAGETISVSFNIQSARSEIDGPATADQR